MVGYVSLTPSVRAGQTRRVGTRRIVIITYPGVQGLDLVGPLEVFIGAAQVLQNAYRVEVVSSSGATVVTESGLAIATEPLPIALPGSDPIDTILVAGGFGVHAARDDAALIDWLRAEVPRARRLGTVCTGTFLAAQAGLLDGHTVTTHWARAGRLAAEFPAVTVDPDPIFTRAGPLSTRTGEVWTSAGVTAGIDLALAMVEDDIGTDVAQTVARWLVMFLRRPGGQSQFAAPVWMPRAERSSVRVAQQAIETDPAADHRVATLAALAAMSPRHFSRVFSDEVGETPGHYVERIRVESARRQLEDTTDTVAVIATCCGFGTAETMRRCFVRRIGVSPDRYRRRFGSAA